MQNPPAGSNPGAGCSSNATCLNAAGTELGALCVSGTIADGGPSPYPGGYCLPKCESANASCSGGTCLDLLNDGDGYCLANCSGANTGKGSCRVGYVCNELIIGSPAPWGVCVPNCMSTGCGQTATCNALGYCV